jgi:hypothetical protein
MSSKRYYDESYSYHDNWCSFLNEQGDPAAAQAAAAQAAQQKEAEVAAAQIQGGEMAGELIKQALLAGDAGDAGGRVADVHIRRFADDMSDLAHKEISIGDFLTQLGQEVGDTGKDIQGAMPK